MVDRANNPTWYIVGAGALGCLWASYLSQAGLAVKLVVRRKQQAQALNQTGLQFKRLDAAHSLNLQIQTITLAQLACEAPLQRVIIATKAYQSVAAGECLKPYLGSAAHVLLLQNGMGSQQGVCALLSQHNIYALVSSDGALLHTSNEIHHTGIGHNQLGLLQTAGDKALGSTSAKALLAQLQTSQLEIRWHESIEQALLNKLAINCAINALTATLDCRNGELANAAKLPRFKALCDEIQIIVDALCQERKLEPIAVYSQALAVVQKTAANSSSMRQDIKLQRPSEIAFINGYLVNLAEKLNLPSALNQQLCEQIYQLSPSSPTA